jgi:hypothetical protein
LQAHKSLVERKQLLVIIIDAWPADRQVAQIHECFCRDGIVQFGYIGRQLALLEPWGKLNRDGRRLAIDGRDSGRNGRF